MLKKLITIFSLSFLLISLNVTAQETEGSLEDESTEELMYEYEIEDTSIDYDFEFDSTSAFDQEINFESQIEEEASETEESDE